MVNCCVFEMSTMFMKYYSAGSTGVTPIGQRWTNARGPRGLGGPNPDYTLKLESQNSTRTLFTRHYVVTCEYMHLITCCMLPYIHFCVFTIIEITAIY